MKYIKKYIIFLLLVTAGASLTWGQSASDSITVYYVLHSDFTASITSVMPQSEDTLSLFKSFVPMSYACAEEIEFEDVIEENGVRYQVTSIEPKAFEKKNIQYIVIPNSVSNIGSYAFRECDSLKECDFGNTSTPINKIDEYAFYKSGVQYIYGNRQVKVLERSAFEDCHNLQFISENIIIHSMGSRAFKGCRQLKDAPLHEGLKEISYEAFQGCFSLDSIYIPSTVNHVYSNAFRNCQNLSRIEVNPKNPQYDSRDNCNAVIEVDKSRSWSDDYNKPVLIIGCSATKIPNSVEIIDSHAFDGVEIETLDIPYGVKEIRSGAFQYCIRLKSITLPNSLTTIVNNAFKGCRSISSIILPNSLTSVEPSSWYEGICPQCSNLEMVMLSNSMNVIPRYCFENNMELQYVYIPEGIVGIGFYAFQNCKKIKSLVMPGSIQKVDCSAFEGCDSLIIYTPNPSTFSCLKKSNHQVIRVPQEDLLYRHPYPFYKHVREILWERKTPYESDDMWQERISNPVKKLEAIDKFNNEYITYHIAQKPPHPHIGRYNADMEFFPIMDETYGMIRLSVPYDDWQDVKANWNNAQMDASYKIVDDKIVFQSLTVTMPSNKIYSSL